jgi:hypothetical protein
MNREEIVNKLFSNQIKDINPKYQLNAKDIVRLASYLNSDPFDQTECCKWKGAISKSSHQSKYINFWFNKKKQALHRILYLNYISDLPKNKYLRFKCSNPNMRGVCCNINHLDLINDDNDTANVDNVDNQNDNINQPNNIAEYDVLDEQLGKTAKSKKTKKGNHNTISSKSDNLNDSNNQTNQNNPDIIINSCKNNYSSNKFIIVFDD